MANSTLNACPPPFLDLSNYPGHSGDIAGEFCGQVSETLFCCLPCPLEQWIYSDTLPLYVSISQWFNVPALVCQIFLLVTFAVLPQERSKVQGRYLSIGLCVGLVLLELAFIIPLGTRPSRCYNAITPNDMYTSMSCAWTGALLELGSMAGCVWILLRSLYTHLRVCWDVQLTKRYVWLAHALGWGLPAIFLAVSLPITKLSYRLTSTCLPNPHASFVTWFGWLIAFALLGALIQFATTGFCVVVFMRSYLAHSHNSPTANLNAANSTQASGGNPVSPVETVTSTKRLAWGRVKQVLTLQWRSIVLSFVVIIDVVYSGIVYVLMTTAEQQDADPSQTNEINEWSECLINTSGNKNKCLHLAKSLTLGEGQVVATLFMASLIGIFTFCLMIRWSMLVGWWELIRRSSRRDSVDFELMSLGSGPKHMSLGKPLDSERMDKDVENHPEPMPVPLAVPEPGDVTKRHETTNLFEFGLGDEEEKEKALQQELDDVV